MTFTAPPKAASYPPARSVLGKNLQSLRVMLSLVTEIQTLFGGATPAEALQRIYIGSLPRPASAKYTVAELNNYRPFALVGPSPDLAVRSRHELVGGLDTHGRQGEIDIMLERQHPTTGEDDVNDSLWIDMVGMVRQSNDAANPGLIELHESGGGHLSLRMVEVLEIYRGAEDEINSLGDYQRARIRIYWGRI